MDLPGLNNSAGIMIETAGASARGERLRQLSNGQPENKESREGLVKAAQEFEGVFLNTLMKAMRKTVPDNKMFNSSGPTKYYQQMHDMEIAKALATGHSGMGVADLIIKQFEANIDTQNQSEGESAVPAIPEGPVLQPRHPMIGPPAPPTLNRYHGMSSVGEVMASRQKLRFFAAEQGTAVADTLHKFENEITRAALKSGLEPSLILAVVMEESAGDPLALSPKGARGLMQLMPATARELGVTDTESPRENLLGGSTYLAQMLEQFDGNLDLALAAYNAGPGNVEKAGPGVPPFPETQRYIEAVKTRYKALGGGMDLANEKQ